MQKKIILLMNSLNKPCSEIESKKVNEDKKIEIVLKIEFEKEKNEIYRVYEISDNRLAVEFDKCIKIYSLKNFKLITNIEHERIDNSIELKNKDIAIHDYSTVNFYKLSENDYVFYQKLSEEGKIYEIYELKNETLALCIRRQINLYSKSNEGYQNISKIKLGETVANILEIKDNILFIFEKSRSGTFATADYSPYSLEILNFEKKKIKPLYYGDFSYYNDDSLTYSGCDSIIKKNKYLLVRYANNFDIYDIENYEDIKCIYKLERNKNPKDFPSNFLNLANFNDDNFLVLQNKDIYKYDEISNKIIFVKKLEIEMEEIIDVIKLKNNYLVAYNKNEIFLIKC